MNARNWLNYFLKAFNKLEYKESSDKELTEFIGKVLDIVGKDLNCTVIRKRTSSNKDNPSGEYLNIDAFFFDNIEYNLPTGIEYYDDPFVLPLVAVEMENDPKINKIAYCLWKLLCIRATIRVLVCYQENKDDVKFLSKNLEKIIWEKGLLKGEHGDLYIIIGNEQKTESTWEDYFSIFEWRNDRLEKIEDLY